MQQNSAGAAWRSSSHSSGDGQCVEVRDDLSGVVPVRDSKDPTGPRLFFEAGAWASFVGALKTSRL
ncbi:DUF397 domain-containing protein [Streptomyces sp. NPDC058855]|uniref:DUF397 domain-containing protein n=1 Tax=Streptomyces sp. NPDC058855 TaxID=3346651 RepID=UPI0036C6BA6F